MDISEMTIDPTANLQIRPTDNGQKDCDIETLNQEPVPIELDENGLPVGWSAPKEGE